MTLLLEWSGGAAGAWIPFAIDMAVKSAAVLLAAFAVTLSLRGASASVRHHVWALAFVAVLALPVLAATLPAWRVPIAAWTAPRRTSAAPAGDGVRVATAPAAPVDEAVPAPRSQAAAIAVGGPRPADGDADGLPGSVWTLALFVWLAGTTLFLARLGIGVLSAWWTSRVAARVDDADWHATVERLRDELGIGREVRLLRSSWVGTPMAWGIFRPALLLPDAALDWSESRRRAVALHELAHVKRRDCLVHLLAQATRAVHWLNPLAWIGAARIRAERERACDDMVLTAGTRSADYAKLLLDVARSRGDRRLSWAAVSMARPSELEGRLLAILDPARNRRGLGRAGALVARAAVVGLVLPLAAFQAAPEPPAVSTAAPAVVDGGIPPAPAPLAVPVPRIDTRLPIDGWALVPPTFGRAPVAAALPRVRPDAPLQAAPADTTEERLVAVMVRALRHERADFRAQAAHTLGTMESELGVAPLSDAIDDESPQVRSNVAWALGMIESPDGVPALSIAIRDENPEVRSQAAWALGMIESPEGVAPLLPALEDASDSVRSQAAWALGMIESREAVDGLIRTLRGDSSPEVRSQAAWALGMIEDRSAADALVDALEDDDPEVAKQAMWALGMIIG